MVNGNWNTWVNSIKPTLFLGEKWREKIITDVFINMWAPQNLLRSSDGLFLSMTSFILRNFRDGPWGAEQGSLGWNLWEREQLRLFTQERWSPNQSPVPVNKTFSLFICWQDMIWETEEAWGQGLDNETNYNRCCWMKTLIRNRDIACVSHPSVLYSQQQT